MKNVLKLSLISLTIILFSCTTLKNKPPVYENIDLRDALHWKDDISAIKAEFSIIFKKENKRLKGDGILNITKEGNLEMRIYSLGFLAFELIVEDEIIKSEPVIDKMKGMILTYGLRDCLFWWDIRDFEIREGKETFIIEDLSRKIWIDKKTMLPVQQLVIFKDKRELFFSYEKPKNMGGIWYPSEIRIELSNYTIILEFDEMSFIFDV